MKATITLQCRSGNTEHPLQVRTAATTITLPFKWKKESWHRGKPKGTNAQGLPASKLRDMIDRIRTITDELPAGANAQSVRIALQSFISPKDNNYPVTLADVVRAYKKTHILSLSTIRQLDKVARDIPTLSAGSINTYLRNARGRLRTSTFNLYRSHLKRLIEFGKRTAMLPADLDISISSAPTPHNAPVFLSRDELRAIDALELTDELNTERHRFIFQCLTGLRASDIARLDQASITADTLTLSMKKTGKATTIPMTAKTLAHLSHFIGCRCPDTAKRDRMLRQIARLAGIDTPTSRTTRIGDNVTSATTPKYNLVTTHTARRTFVCLLVSSGVPLPVIMSMTGHTTMKAIAPYVAVSDPAKLQAISTLDY